MGEELRRFDRVREPFRVECRRYGALAETWRPVTAVDLSASGFAFITDEWFQEGESVSIQFRLPGQSEPLQLRAIIARSVQERPGAIECAAEFSHITADEQGEIDRLVQFLKSRPDSP